MSEIEKWVCSDCEGTICELSVQDKHRAARFHRLCVFEEVYDSCDLEAGPVGWTKQSTRGFHGTLAASVRIDQDFEGGPFVARLQGADGEPGLGDSVADAVQDLIDRGGLNEQ